MMQHNCAGLPRRFENFGLVFIKNDYWEASTESQVFLGYPFGANESIDLN